MRIAVTSTGDSPQSVCDSRFGRAAFFLVYDSTDDEWVVVQNDGLNEAHGAGLVAAQKLIDLGVDAVVTGRCGPKALALLSSADISVAEGYTGSVAGAPAVVSGE